MVVVDEDSVSSEGFTGRYRLESQQRKGDPYIEVVYEGWLVFAWATARLLLRCRLWLFEPCSSTTPHPSISLLILSSSARNHSTNWQAEGHEE
jgi:hypothetical protein